jgi:hypothetical protein
MEGTKNIYFIFFNDSSFDGHNSVGTWFSFFFGWKQEEIGFKIDAVEAVAMKLLQRLNYSASVMKTSAVHLQDGTFFTFNFHIYFQLCFS